VGKLSYEHVPPRAAFNDRPIVARAIDEIIKKGSPDNVKRHIYQRGAGAYTLCGRCNSNTGHWYGPAFVEWVTQGMYILQAARLHLSIYNNFHIFPLRVIKQIACMFFSVNTVRFRKVHPALEKFVLDRGSRYLPEEIRLYVFYAVGGCARQSGIMSHLDINKPLEGTTFSEITFPPFGYVMSFDRPPDAKMLDISHFSYYQFNTYRAMSFRIPVLPVISYLPGDYRSQAELNKA
jgi:hypothetical protein